MASFHAVFYAVEIFKVVRGGDDDVFVADHLVGWPLVSLRVSCLGESVRLAVYLAFSELDPVVDFLEFNCLLCWLRSISAHRLDILEVPVVCTYCDPVFRALQIVCPMLEGSHDGQKFLLIDRVVLFSRRELLRQECNWPRHFVVNL